LKYVIVLLASNYGIPSLRLKRKKPATKGRFRHVVSAVARLS